MEAGQRPTTLDPSEPRPSNFGTGITLALPPLSEAFSYLPRLWAQSQTTGRSLNGDARLLCDDVRIPDLGKRNRPRSRDFIARTNSTILSCVCRQRVIGYESPGRLFLIL
jgi:hypothetical protein